MGPSMERNSADVGGEPNPEQLLFALPGETLRFVPGSRAFLRRTRLVNGLLGSWPLVFGSGSWLEAHLVARLAMASRHPNLRGCGINAEEVWDLVQQELEQSNRGAPLVVLCDSLGVDQVRGLTQRLRALNKSVLITVLVRNEQWLTAATLADCQAQVILHAESFGTGVVIRALQALRRGQTYQDPRIRERLDDSVTVQLNGRERQVLQGLARGFSNKQIAKDAEIATTTVRDYVSRLCRRLGAANRTQVVTQAIALGLVRQRG
jgi:DNA-binding NarL/FixJ family response regulator